MSSPGPQSKSVVKSKPVQESAVSSPAELNPVDRDAGSYAGHGTHAHLCMPEDARKRAARRLAIARGHVESIIRMLDGPEIYCMNVLRQIKAVQGALSGAGEVVLRGHLEAHVSTAHERGDANELIEELMEALKYT